MSFYRCFTAVTAALGRRITVDEFEALWQRLDDERARLFAGGFPSDWLSVSRTVAQQIEIEKAIAQRNVLRNKLVYADAKAFIAGARATVDAGRALEARLVGINTPIEGGRRSIAAEAHGLWTTAVGAMLADLRRAGGGGDRLVRLFSQPSFELEVAKALRGEPAHADALAIAQAIEKAREDLRRQENDAGGWRGKLDGYVTRQSHDSLRVRTAGYEKWKAAILPRLDHKRTFERQAELLAQLRQEAQQVRENLEAGGRDLVAAQEELRRADRLDDKATARGRRLEADERELAGQVNEARKAMADALQRYMDLSVKAREGGRGAAPLLGEAGQEAVTGRQLREARAALTRTHDRLQELHRQASAGRGKSIESDLARQRLADWVEASATIAQRIERGVDLMYELGDKLHAYEARLRGPVDPEQFLRRIYNAIAADTWMHGRGPEFQGLLSKIGPSNLADRRATHRELHFKSAEDEVAYMRQFGAGGLADSVMRELESAGSTIALMRGLGANPEAMFQLLRSELLREARDTGDNALAKSVNRRRLDWMLAEVMGGTRQVANPSIAAWSASIRTVQSMAKLGGAMLSSFGDIATAAAELRYQGRGALSSYADMLDGLLRGRRSGERRVILDLLGVGFESLSGQVMGRLGGESAPPGGLARAAALFFRLNGLSWWTDTHKSSAGLVIARYFATAREQRFAELPDRTQRLLKQYGIRDGQWELLRTAGVNAAEDGTEFLTLEGIKAIPLERFADPSKIEAEGERVLRERRDRLASAYAALVTDRVDHAVVSPGARERAYINQGTARGDVLGEALRFVMQFKSFSVAMTMRSLGRDIHGGDGAWGSATVRVMALAFQLGVFGYLSMAVKDMLQGKNPRDPLSPNTIAAAMLQGGGAGIVGDYAFGEFNRFGQSALETAAGPTLGSASDLFRLYAIAKDPESSAAGRYGPSLAANGLRVAMSNTPMASLWWARPAINYLALYPIQEQLRPGYLRDMQSRIKRENKQTFWLPPSGG